MTLEEIKNLPDTEDVVLPAGDIKSIAAQLEAQAEKVVERTAPAFIKAYNQNSNEEKEKAVHNAKWFVAVAKRDEAAAVKAFTENPQWYYAKAAFSEAANGEGLYTVPSSWSDQIFSNIERYGFARKLAHIYPMPTRDVKFTTGGAVTVTWPGVNTAPTLFDATSFFAQTALTAQTMAAAYVIQKELLDDTIVDLMGYLAKQYGRAVSKEEDVQFFGGTGSPFNGLFTVCASNTNNVSLASTKTSVANITWTKMNDLKLATNTDIQLDGSYIIKQTALGYLFNEVDDNHRPIRNNPTTTSQESLPKVGIDQAPYTYNNSPLFVLPDALFPADAANKAIAAFGDFANYGILGVRRDMTVDTYDQAYAGVDLAGKRQLAIQVTERIGVAFPDVTAFALLKTAAS